MLLIKFLLFTGLVSASFLNVFAQAEHTQVYHDYTGINDNTKKVLQSKIESITETYTVGDKTDTLSITVYDRSARLVQLYKSAVDTSKGEKRSYFMRYSYVYDKDGLLTDRIDSTNAEVRKMKIFYDDMGSISREEEYNSKGKMLLERSHEYDQLVRVIETDEVNYEKNCKANIKYAYDSYNGLAKLTVKDLCKFPDGRARDYVYSYKYDKSNNIIEKNSVYPAGAYKTETYKYDAKGNLLSGYEITNKNDYIEYVNTYDKSFNKIKVDKTEVISDVKTSYTEQLKYDNAGNLIEIQLMGPNNMLMSVHKYIYRTY